MTYKKSELLNFRIIRVTIPRKFILTCLNKRYYTQRERTKIVHKIRELEQTIFKAQHALSVVEKLHVRFQPTAFGIGGDSKID